MKTVVYKGVEMTNVGLSWYCGDTWIGMSKTEAKRTVSGWKKKERVALLSEELTALLEGEGQ